MYDMSIVVGYGTSSWGKVRRGTSGVSKRVWAGRGAVGLVRPWRGLESCFMASFAQGVSCLVESR